MIATGKGNPRWESETSEANVGKQQHEPIAKLHLNSDSFILSAGQRSATGRNAARSPNPVPRGGAHCRPAAWCTPPPRRRGGGSPCRTGCRCPARAGTAPASGPAASEPNHRHQSIRARGPVGGEGHPPVDTPRGSPDCRSALGGMVLAKSISHGTLSLRMSPAAPPPRVEKRETKKTCKKHPKKCKT